MRQNRDLLCDQTRARSFLLGPRLSLEPLIIELTTISWAARSENYAHAQMARRPFRRPMIRELQDKHEGASQRHGRVMSSLESSRKVLSDIFCPFFGAEQR